MSTRCRIGIQNKDGTITSIYCHHDGYLSHVGKVLVANYTDEETVKKLLDLGDMSSLGTKPIDNPNAWESPSMMDVLKGDYAKVYFQLHPEDMCDTYKTRGEDCPKTTSSNKDDYYTLTKECWGEYAYIFNNGEWIYTDVYEGPDWKTVQEGLEQEKKEDED